MMIMAKFVKVGDEILTSAGMRAVLAVRTNPDQTVTEVTVQWVMEPVKLRHNASALVTIKGDY